ncbi:MAG: DNA mismatch repair protein MutS [Chloroflexota bacterium]|nr:MAG: DNA mismatch repair protein MutS [Chloroflexota bacterium]
MSYDGAGPPVWRQYSKLKAQHPGSILLFRLGDFYETFDDDAELVARELDIVLTSREMGKDQRHRLAGIPYHALEGHLARLVGRGYRIAICEQLTDPSTSRGLVERDVVRVVTPGTIVETALLDTRANNYLAAVVPIDGATGLAFVDVTTGEFACCEALRQGAGRARRLEAASPSLPRSLIDEIARLGPAEIVVPSDDPRAGPPKWLLDDVGPACHLSPVESWRAADQITSDGLRRHFAVATLEGFGLTDSPAARAAAGLLLWYVSQTARSALAALRPPRRYELSAFMTLDPATRRGLELTVAGRDRERRGALIEVLDRARTPMGGRLVRAWLSAPLLDVTAIEARLDSVEAIVRDPIARGQVAATLRSVPDIERLLARISQRSATARDVRALRIGLTALPGLRAVLMGSHATRDAFASTVERLPDLSDVADLIDRGLVDEPPPDLSEGGVIRPEYADELANLRRDTADARDWIANLESRERERTGVRSLRVGYNRVFGYYIEVTAAALRAPVTPELRELGASGDATVQDGLEAGAGYQRRQTLVNGERFVTDDLKQYERRVVAARDAIVAVETRLFDELCAAIATRQDAIAEAAHRVAEIDVLAGWAELVVESDYARPAIDDGSAIEIVGGRHPVVERTALPNGFVANDARLDFENEQIVILTGPNMAGKSTYLRQVGLIVLMAQMGCFVPAEAAHIGIVDRVFTRVGAQDDIASGQSTFMVEMAETAAIVNHATRRSLLILDEVGRGTATFDGMAIARAIVEHLHEDPRLGCRTLFATHYHELTDLARELPRVRNARVEVLEEGDRVVFLHRVVPGGADRSYGIHVADLAGIPASVTRRAKALLRDLERGPRKRRTVAAAPSLFDPPPDPLIERIADIDLDAMTPLQSLHTLYEVREEARRRRGNC